MSLNREQPMRPFLDELADAFEAYEVPAGSIGTNELADGAVTSPKIGDGAVHMNNLGNDVQIPQPTDAQVTSAVNAALAAHPEWTTTVQDGSITGVKIADDTIPDAKLAQTGGVLENLKEFTGNESYTFVDSGYYRLNVSTVDITDIGYGNIYKHLSVPCIAGDMFVIYGTSVGAAARMYAFVDSSYNVLALAPQGESYNGIKLTAPTSAAYLLLNDYDGTVYVYSGESIPRNLRDVRNVSLGKNLIGPIGGIYYPIPELHTGDVLTLSTSDGELAGTTIGINLYDSNKNLLANIALFASVSSRSVKLEENADGAKYLRYVNVPSPSRPIQIELGASATAYEPYFGNAMYLYENGLNSQNVADRTFNAAYHIGATDYATKCQQFSALMYGDYIAGVDAPSDCESFLFFTDPHFSTGSTCQEYIAQIQKYYNSTPTTFCLSGGDWLNSGDTPAQACFKMGYINGFMSSMFDNCHMLVGNHDTNFLGKLTPESENRTTRLSTQSIIDLWYRGGKAYYEFNGASTRFFCFDTGVENQLLSWGGGYGYEQAEWFADKLTTNTAAHVAIALHILIPVWEDQTLQPLTQLLLNIAKAFNDRSSISVNGTTYSFTNAIGKVEFLISGHYHDDAVVTVNDIPCIVTSNVCHDTNVGPTFDLVFVDYSNSVIKMVRVGYGSDRTVSLA